MFSCLATTHTLPSPLTRKHGLHEPSFGVQWFPLLRMSYPPANDENTSIVRRVFIFRCLLQGHKDQRLNKVCRLFKIFIYITDCTYFIWWPTDPDLKCALGMFFMFAAMQHYGSTGRSSVSWQRMHPCHVTQSLPSLATHRKPIAHPLQPHRITKCPPPPVPMFPPPVVASNVVIRPRLSERGQMQTNQ